MSRRSNFQSIHSNPPLNFTFSTHTSDLQMITHIVLLFVLVLCRPPFPFSAIDDNEFRLLVGCIEFDCRFAENAIISSTAFAVAMTALDARSESPFATASATSAARAAALAPIVGFDCLAMCWAVAWATAAATAVEATILICVSELMSEYCFTISENCSKGFFNKEGDSWLEFPIKLNVFANGAVASESETITKNTNRVMLYENYPEILSFMNQFLPFR